MWSRTWCFNKTLLRKNLTRFWPLWVMASFLAALAAHHDGGGTDALPGTTSMNALYVTEGYYGVLSYLIPPGAAGVRGGVRHGGLELSVQ